MEELRRLYNNIAYSTSPTDFYDRVYKYLKYVNNNNQINKLIAEDRRLEHKHSLESKESFLAIEGEDWTDSFLRSAQHMRSGHRQFLSFYYDTAYRDICTFFEWNEQGLYSAEFLIMKSGAPMWERASKFKPLSLSYVDETVSLKQLNKVYIEYYPLWVSFMEEFHDLLIKKLEKPVSYSVLELRDNGYFKYFDKEGNLTVSSRKFKLLKILYDNANQIVPYSDILRDIYKKEDSKANRIELHTLVRDIKQALSILPLDSGLEDRIENHSNLGYLLNLSNKVTKSE